MKNNFLMKGDIASQSAMKCFKFAKMRKEKQKDQEGDKQWRTIIASHGKEEAERK